MICSALQGLSKTKLIYISCATGLITKTILDIPLIFLFNKIGIYPFYGAILATTIGYCLSLAIPLYTLHHKYHFSYKQTIKSLPKLIFTIIILVTLCLIIKPLVFNHLTNKIYMFLALAVIGIIALIIYYPLNRELLNELIGNKLITKFAKKKSTKQN